MDDLAAVDVRTLESFVYREARLADEHDYDAWEALWTDDAVYWVPANGADTDPERVMSVIYDNRSRIRTRLAQLRSGKRHSQTPPSSLRRLVTNVEVLVADQPAGEVMVGANFAVYESRERGVTTWAGRYQYRLRMVDGEWRMAAKKAVLVDNDRPLPTLSFLI